MAPSDLFDAHRRFQKIAQDSELNDRCENLTVQEARHKIEDLFPFAPGDTASEDVPAGPALKRGI